MTTLSRQTETPPRMTTVGQRRFLPSGLLLTAPVLMSVGYALHPTLPPDAAGALRDLADERTVYLAAKIMVTVGSLLFVPLILAVRRRAVPDRGRALATVAAAMCIVGYASNALSQTLWGYLLWFASAPSVDLAAGAAVVEASEQASLPATLLVSFFSVPLFALGSVLLTVALWRSGAVPRWVPVAIVVAGFGGAAFPTGPVNLLTGAVTTVAFAVALFPPGPRREVAR